MKLHLPVFLRKSLLSCLSAFIVCTVGSGAAWAEPQNLIFGESSLTWDTQSESFVNEEGNSAVFAEGDNVSFIGESDVALRQDITAGTVAIEQGAAVAIDLDVYELNVDRIELSGLLDMGYSLHIGEGTTLAVQSAGAVLDSNLVLGDKGGFEVGAAASLNNNLLTLQGNTSFTLTAAGDGKTYTLLTGVSGLLDAQGNAITLDSSNNAISNYFDTTQPGTGFWADATLQLSADGILRFVRHSEAVKAAVTISTRRTGSVDYQYHEGVHFADIEYTVGSSSGSDAYGGAIYGDTITLSDNGSVTFSGNTASGAYSAGGAIYGDNIDLSDNGSVAFRTNTALISAESSGPIEGYARGGAIYGDNILLSENREVSFEGNVAYGEIACFMPSPISLDLFSVSYENIHDSCVTSCGGAIYGKMIELREAGRVMFSGNTTYSTASSPYLYASSTDAYASGGAIYGSTIELSGNESVEFSGNTASSSSSSSAASYSANAYAYGGAIYGNTIELSGNESVEFSGNTASSSSANSATFSYANDYAYGGAIYGYAGDIVLSNNGRVRFEANEARSNYGSAYGGAIYRDWGAGDHSVILHNNRSVEFLGNKASSNLGYAYGGAIYGESASTIALSNNGKVTFSGNTADYGGAIYGDDGSTIVLSNNDSVTFSGNEAASGGAIYGSACCSIVLSSNEGVTFSGNEASSGGVIYGEFDSTIELSNNGIVTFSGNFGVAICTRRDLSIRNNASVLFEKNLSYVDSTYRLRSIYALGGEGVISLSAAEDRSIEFRESVYIASGSTVNLNADYTYLDEEGVSVTVEQKGDILFTGAYVERYLNDMLEAAGYERTATAEEILSSRTSEVNTLTHLYGGRLRVEDGAIYKGYGITAEAGSASKVLVKDASLNHAGYDLTFNAGTALEVAGESTIRGHVNLQEGSVFKLELGAVLCLHETAGADAATLTVNGSALLSGSATLNAGLTLADGATLDMDYLDAGAVTLNGALTFGEQVTIGENLLALLEDIKTQAEGVALFTGIDSLTLPQTATTTTSGRVWAGVVFSNLASNQNYYLVYQADTGTLSIVYNVPEPATATLSLLALAALAARRRRK